MVPAATARSSTGEAGTRYEAAAQALRTVAAAAGLGARATETGCRCLRAMAASWADRPLSAPPSWSGLGSDASGCDMSLVLDGVRSEVRITVEAQGRPASPRSYWTAASRLSETLAAEYGADLSALRGIQDLFADPAPDAAGVLWHGAVFRRGSAPWFKVYLHLMATGRTKSRAVTRAALGRLGLEACWPAIAARLEPDDELLFLSLDLLPADEARVKLYIRHGETDADRLDRAAALIDPGSAGSVRAFVTDLTGAPDRPIRRGALTSLHLARSSPEPIHLSTHLRLYPHCAASDAVLSDRLCRALRRLRLPAAAYEAAVVGLSNGFDEGLHGWASLQRSDGRPSVTVYVSPRLYFPQHGPIAIDPQRMWPSPIGPILASEEPACASA